jgi:LPXTG-motif cell wall-anchored protein
MAEEERPLPATASNESLLLMTGLLALAGGLALRRTLSHN